MQKEQVATDMATQALGRAGHAVADAHKAAEASNLPQATRETIRRELQSLANLHQKISGFWPEWGLRPDQ